jgi:hypothetical protein
LKSKKDFKLNRFKTEFILNCLKLPKSLEKTISWPKEMKIMKDLVEKCDDPAFWRHAIPEFEIPSLAWFLTPKGRSFLNEKHKRFFSKIKTLEKEHNTETLSSEKYGEDLVEKENSKKIKTLKDFLNNKK